MSIEGDGLLDEVAGRLEGRRADLVESQLRALRGFQAYDRVPEEDLRRSCGRNVARVIATLRQLGRLPAGIEEDERASGRRRALQGVRTEDVVEAYRIVLAVLRDAFIEEATAVEADPWQVLLGTRRLWDLTDRFSNVLVAARQEVEIETARRDERQRVELIQRLLRGAPSSEPTDAHPLYDELADRQYWVVRARQSSAGTQRLSRHLELASADTVAAPPLVVPLDGDVAGLCARRPGAMEGAVIALAGPVPLSAVGPAFVEATRVLTVACRCGRGGVVDSSSLSLRLVVEGERELGEQLYARYLGSLTGDAARTGDLVATLRMYLGQGRSVSATARALSVHENTVRYRLDRYQALAHADLGDTDVLVEVWWALEHLSMREP